MQIKDIMHKNPVCCTPEDSLQDVARAMVDCDCGAIPVVEDARSMKLLGIVTDRDIVCRAVAPGKNLGETKVRECYSTPVAAVTPQSDLEDALELMQRYQIRRLPVVDENGACLGVVTQSMIVRHGTERQTARLLKEVSRKTKTASAVGAAVQ